MGNVDVFTFAVQEDYVKALSRATSLFILYSTTRANEVASSKNRRTIHSQDVLESIAHLGFEHIVPELVTWLAHFNNEKEKENAQKPKRQSSKSKAAADDSELKAAVQEEDSQNSAPSE